MQRVESNLPPKEIVGRYFLATFPIIEKEVGVDRKKKHVVAKKSQAERHALRSLRLLEKSGIEKRGVWRR